MCLYLEEGLVGEEDGGADGGGDSEEGLGVKEETRVREGDGGVEGGVAVVLGLAVLVEGDDLEVVRSGLELLSRGELVGEGALAAALDGNAEPVVRFFYSYQ